LVFDRLVRHFLLIDRSSLTRNLTVRMHLGALHPGFVGERSAASTLTQGSRDRIRESCSNFRP
jgi:hypothetical protein